VPPRPRTIGVGIVAAALWLFAPRLSQACTIPEDEFNNVVETFNEPDSRFESQYTKITDGKLRITAEADPVAPLTALEPGSYNDFDACVTVENKQATFHQNYKAWAGLAFWANEEATDFYAFVVDAKRSFAVLQFKNDQPSELVGWSKNDAIGPVTTLRVVTAKDHVTCFANDVQVCNLTITPPGAGSLGFAVWQNEKSGASFDFDNFVVIEPKGSTP
jgi:hypothetical protein